MSMDIDVEAGGVARRQWYRQPWVIASSALVVVALVVGGSLAVAAAASGDDADPGDGASVEAAASESATPSGSDAAHGTGAASGEGASASASPSASASASATASASAGAGDDEVVPGGPVTLGAPQPWQEDCSATAGAPDYLEFIHFRVSDYRKNLVKGVHPGDEYRTLLDSGFTIDIDGITPGTAPDTASVVAWSPDSRYVAWIHGNYSGTLTILDVQAGTSFHVNASPSDHATLAWSSDSSRLAYMGKSGVDEFVAVVTAATGATTTVLSDAHINGFAWSPDGASLAISHSPYKPGAVPQTKDSVVDIVTGTAVTHTGILGLSPAWSPDGEALFFLGDDDADGQWGVVRYAIATSSVAAVTPEAAFQGFLIGHWQRFTPTFSPDGSTLAVVAPSGAGPNQVAAYVARADGTNAKQVSSLQPLEAPLWNRQGTRFLVDNHNLVVYDAAKGSAKEFAFAERDPVWMPDGQTPVAWGAFCEDMVIRAQLVTSETQRATINFGGGWVEKSLPYISPDGTHAVADLRGAGYAGFGLYLFEMP